MLACLNGLQIGRTLATAHSQYAKDLTIDELQDLHYAYNPALTTAQRNNLDIFFQDLRDDTTEYTPEIAQDILDLCIVREQARGIAQGCIEVINGKTNDLSEVVRLLSEMPVQNDGDELIPVTDDLEEILAGVKDGVKWFYNIPDLKQRALGGGPGIFTIIAARPEVGKTAAWVSFSASAEGFCSQGATVHGIINEEKAFRTKARAITACTGKTLSEIETSLEDAKVDYNKIRDKFKVYDCVGLTFNQLDRHVQKTKPDIVVIDQLDKMEIDGDFNSGHEKLRAIYTRAREFAKANDIFVVGISQLSADAEGKTVLDASMLENSKTGKFAEADAILLIGATKQDDVFRYINLAKNKIGGDHGTVVCKLNAPLSRYEA